MNWKLKTLIIFIAFTTVVFWVKKKYLKFNFIVSNQQLKETQTAFTSSQNSLNDLDFLCKRKEKEISKQKNLLSESSIDTKKFTRRNQMNRLRNEPLDLIVRDIRGKIWDLYCYKNQKYLIINLWATWCSPCVEELLSLSYLAEKTKKNTFVIAISTESTEILSQFIKKAFPDLKEDLKIVSDPTKYI